jgi:hypothetical protein
MDLVRAWLGLQGTMEAMRGYLLRDVQREKTLGSTDAGLSFLVVKRAQISACFQCPMLRITGIHH